MEDVLLTRIYLIRHGQSLGNLERRFLGHTDLDLSELGYIQAEATATALADVKIDAIYSSDLLRAMNTARPHARLRGVDVIPSRALREIYAGKWENLLVDDIIKGWGDFYKNVWHGRYGECTVPGGESTLSSGQRFYDEVKRICELHPGETVLIASHASVIRSFYGIVKGLAPSSFATETVFPANASYSIFNYEEGKFNVEAYSCDEHLKDVGITKVNF